MPGCGGLLCSLRSVFPQPSSPAFQGACVQGSDCGHPVGSIRDSASRRLDFHHLEVKLCSLARRFLGRKAHVFEGSRIVKKLGAAVTRCLALCPPVVIQLRQRRLKWLRTQLIWEQSSGHPSPPLAASPLRHLLVERAPQ